MFEGLTRREIIGCFAGALAAAPILYGYIVVILLIFGGRAI